MKYICEVNALHMTKTVSQFKTKLPLRTVMLQMTTIDTKNVSVFLLLSIIIENMIIIIKEVTDQGSDPTG